MHTVELLEQAIALAGQCGFVVRQDWFGGAAAGGCEFKGRRLLFIDLSLSPHEQLQQVLAALRDVREVKQIVPSPQLQKILHPRRAA